MSQQPPDQPECDPGPMPSADEFVPVEVMATADATWLTDDDIVSFSDEIPPLSLHRIGPGIWESVCWIFGAFVLQIIGGLLGGVIAAVSIAISQSEGGAGKVENEELARQMLQDYGGVIFAVVQTVMIVAVLIAVMLRLGRDHRRRLSFGSLGNRLSFRGVAWRHVPVVLVGLLPIMLLSSQMYLVGDAMWSELTRHFPQLQAIDSVDSMSAVQDMTKDTPVFLLVLLVAVAPAVWEELVFRGVIGRGLMARYGVPVGILITSLLFAAMHLHPPHVFALLPLAVYLHVVYVATRSFWVPMAVHLLNNGVALAVLLAADEETMQQAAQAGERGVAPLVLIAAGLSAAAFMTLLMKSRVQHIQTDGRAWSPGFDTVECPPGGEDVRTQCTPTPPAFWIAAGVSLFVMLLALGSTVEVPTGP